MESIWISSCSHFDISPEVSEKWLKRILEKYSDPCRFYHNESEMFLKKLEFLTNSSKSIIFASIFQYFEFDLNSSCVEINCNAFKEFFLEAGLKDVSFINIFNCIHLLKKTRIHFRKTSRKWS